MSISWLQNAINSIAVLMSNENGTQNNFTVNFFYNVYSISELYIYRIKWHNNNNGTRDLNLHKCQQIFLKNKIGFKRTTNNI